MVSLAHHSCDQIEEWIRGYCDIDRRSAVKRLLVHPEPLQHRFELSGARFERLGIRISKKNVIDLIGANALWRADRGVAIRELVQNTVEACRSRTFHSAPADGYTPEVSVAFNHADKTDTIRDNGCGMSERVVLDHCDCLVGDRYCCARNGRPVASVTVMEIAFPLAYAFRNGLTTRSTLRSVASWRILTRERYFKSLTSISIVDLVLISQCLDHSGCYKGNIRRCPIDNWPKDTAIGLLRISQRGAELRRHRSDILKAVVAAPFSGQSSAPGITRESMDSQEHRVLPLFSQEAFPGELKT